MYFLINYPYFLSVSVVIHTLRTGAYLQNTAQFDREPQLEPVGATGVATAAATAPQYKRQYNSAGPTAAAAPVRQQQYRPPPHYAAPAAPQYQTPQHKAPAPAPAASPVYSQAASANSAVPETKAYAYQPALDLKGYPGYNGF